MILSDGEIWDSLANGELGIDPLPDLSSVKPSSIDLKLGERLLVQRSDQVMGLTIDPATIDLIDHLTRYSDLVDLAQVGSFRMQRGVFVLATTFERIRLPNHLAARVEGKSSLARLGVSVHFTAPKIDPGWQGTITLELYNLGSFTVELKPRMEICALTIERLGKPARQGYTGRFQPGS